MLSSINASPIIKANLDGTYKSFTSGEKFPLSTAGLEIDYKRNRLLVACFNGTELMDGNPNTKGAAFLRIYNLKTGIIEKDINLSGLLPDASAYFANDIAVDDKGNVYITDWYARVVYKVDTDGNPSVFWKNETGIPSGTNGIDFHSDGYLLVSLVSVNEKGLYANYGLVKIPSDHLPRFVELPSKKGKHEVILLDDIVRYNISFIFPGYDIKDSFSIKLTRDAELYIDDEFEGDLIEGEFEIGQISGLIDEVLSTQEIIDVNVAGFGIGLSFIVSATGELSEDFQTLESDVVFSGDLNGTINCVGVKQ